MCQIPGGGDALPLILKGIVNFAEFEGHPSKKFPGKFMAVVLEKVDNAQYLNRAIGLHCIVVLLVCSFLYGDLL